MQTGPKDVRLHPHLVPHCNHTAFRHSAIDPAASEHRELFAPTMVTDRLSTYAKIGTSNTTS